MFRSRSKFDNEAPMSRRGVRVGLVVTVVLAMVTVLATTVGVLSSQSGTATLTFVSGTYSAVEGESLTITLASISSEGYDLVLDADMTTAGGFDFDDDVTALVLSPDVGSPTPIRALPQTVSIESGTTVITLWFRATNDLIAETGDKLVLSAKPGTGTAVTTEITLTDPPIVEATFSAPSPITEGGSATIGITLNNPLTLSQLFSRRSGQSGYTVEEYTGSNFEDISSIAGAAFPGDSNNMRYLRNLGFDFWFYGTQHSDIAVSTNGFVGFTDDLDNVEIFTNPTPGNYQEGATPGAGTYDLPTVAPLLSPIAHVNQTPPSSFYGARLGAGTAEDRYIVQYTNAATLVSDPAATPQVRAASTFQVALFASGRIEFRYQNIPTTVLNVSKIGISDGTEMVNTFEEFSYRTNNFEGDAQSDVRLVYTPKDSLINAVIKNSAGDTVETVDILENVAVGAQSGSFMVSHPDNTDWDGTQVYTVELASTVPLVTAPSPAPSVTYTVNDNDDPMVTLQRVSGSGPIAEGASVELRALLTNAPSGGAPENLVVNLIADPASTVDSGDHNLPASVTIDQGEADEKFEVTATDDMLVEFNEMLTVKVNTLGYGGNTPTPATQAEINVEIASDDKITATITASDAAEGGVTTVNISLDQAFPANTPNGAVMLVLDGTDRSNDVSGLPADVTDDLRNGTAASVQVTLTDDSILEGTEVVTVKLSTASVASVLAPVSASFNINDNESGIVSVARVSSTSDYAEGATVQFEFALQPGVTTEVPITVNYELTAATVDEEGNRRAPADATDRAIVLAGGLAPGFAKGLALPVRGLAQMARSVGMETIPKNGNRVLLTIQLTDDTTAEETELLRVGLMGVSASSGVRVDVNNDMDETVIRILDNEAPVFEIIGSGSVNEDDGRYPVTLRRLGRLTHNGMAVNEIEFEIVGDGADEGDFRGPLIRKFTFSPGSALSDLIRLPLADDNSEESDKTFQILVYAPGQMPGQVTPPPTPIVDSSGARFTSITLIDSDVADFFGALPATGGPVLPVWLLLLLALTGVALLVPTLRRM